MKAENPPRRTVLKGALAAGCSLWLPVALTGCDTSKPEPPMPSVAPASPPPAPPSPATSPGTDSVPPAAAPLKVPQSNVQYQPQPNGDKKCSTCLHFIAESNTCKLVEGVISPEGWCSIWVGMS